VIKYERAGCLSVLASFKKKQLLTRFIFQHMIDAIQTIVIKGLATVFSLGSLTCEFQIFYILLSVGEAFSILFAITY